MVRGEASTCSLVPWTRRGDPTQRLCPLGVPTEAMAHEALSGGWCPAYPGDHHTSFRFERGRRRPRPTPRVSPPPVPSREPVHRPNSAPRRRAIARCEYRGRRVEFCLDNSFLRRSTRATSTGGRPGPGRAEGPAARRDHARSRRGGPRLDSGSREGALAQTTTRGAAVGGGPHLGAARWVGAGG